MTDDSSTFRVMLNRLQSTLSMVIVKTNKNSKVPFHNIKLMKQQLMSLIDSIIISQVTVHVSQTFAWFSSFALCKAFLVCC